MTSLRFPLLVVLPLALLAGTAGAATAKPPRAAVFGSREQLRQCLDLGDAMLARRHALEAAAADHNRKFDANDAEDARLVELKARLDRSDKDAILAFNKAVTEHAQHTHDLNAEAEQQEAGMKSFEADKADMDDKCGNLTYKPADVDAVNKERKKAAAG
ncbi:MAG: hypothetical protein JF585_04005 [Burkholderiales bacterium]|jgi:hypothetical protein|nr:hypothetical protein [Burkholderiales bacterium]